MINFNLFDIHIIENKLFTFLDYDGVPWNNNNAEHAIKHFAIFRRTMNSGILGIGIRTCFLEGSVWRKGGCLSRKKHHYILYRPKWDLACSQRRLPIKLKNRHGGSQDFKKMRFSAEFERGFPVHLKTHFRLLERIIFISCRTKLCVCIL